MKKLTTMFAAIICALCCTFGIAACNNGEHECQFTEYGYAGIQHWAYCSVEGCLAQLPPENHTFIDGVCICGNTVLVYYIADDGKSAFVQGWHYGSIEGLNALKNVVVAAEYEGKPVTELKNNAFYGEGEVESITLPVTITKMGDYVFAYSPNLTKVTYKGTKAQWAAISKGANWNADAGNFTIHCTDGDIAVPAA